VKDVSVGTSWRMEIGDNWSAFVGLSAGRVLGPAADSPLTLRRNLWSASTGIARRF
jgi:outer membrane scaffolding protein for murein synthesis (MipA/OmpV family)